MQSVGERVCVCVSHWLVKMLLTHMPVTDNNTTERSQSVNIPGLDCLRYYSHSAELWRTPSCEELPLWAVSDALKHELKMSPNRKCETYIQSERRTKEILSPALIAHVFPRLVCAQHLPKSSVANVIKHFSSLLVLLCNRFNQVGFNVTSFVSNSSKGHPRRKEIIKQPTL